MEADQKKFSGMARDARRRFRDFLLTLDRINPFFLEKCVRPPNGVKDNNLAANRNSYARLSACSISESEDEFRSATKWKARSKGNRRSLAKSRFRHSVLATGGEFENIEKALLLSLTDLTDNNANATHNEQPLLNSNLPEEPNSASSYAVKNVSSIGNDQLGKPTETTFFVTGCNTVKETTDGLQVKNGYHQSNIQENGTQTHNNILDMSIDTLQRSKSLSENKKPSRSSSNRRRSVHSYKKVPVSYDLLDVSDVQMKDPNEMEAEPETRPKEKNTTNLKSDVGQYKEYKLPDIIPDYSEFGRDFSNVNSERSSVISEQQNGLSFNREQKRRLKKRMKEALKSSPENYCFMGNI